MNNLLDMETLLSMRQKSKTLCGVYFLFCNTKLVYIGSSRNINQRLAEHRRQGSIHKHFDSYAFIECGEEDRWVLENKYQKQYREALKTNRKRLRKLTYRKTEND